MAPTPKPTEEKKVANGISNGTVPGPWWVKVIVQVGLPTGLLLIVGYVLYSGFMIPMLSHQEKFIESNISTQKVLVESQGKFAESTESMAESMEQIQHTLQSFDETMKEQTKAVETGNTFMDDVRKAHEGHSSILQENNSVLKDVSATMKRAEETMAAVPEERAKQTKLLEEIRDKLPPNN